MNAQSKVFDVVILGAGGAGMMCAIEAGNRGRSVAIIDHGKQVGSKILISGGGRCNFTNRNVSTKNYVSQNSHFAKSAFSRFPSDQFIRRIEDSGLPFEERKWGQLFFQRSARDFVEFFKNQCIEAGAEIFLQTEIIQVQRNSDQIFEVQTSKGNFYGQSLVVATGGLSLPKVGATGIGYKIAKHFGHSITETVPALDGFVLSEEDAHRYGGFAGIALDTKITCGDISFTEALLFTHAGLSGPVSLQASLHWHSQQPIEINLLYKMDLMEWFRAEKKKGNTKLLKNLLCEFLPARLAERFCELHDTPKLPLPEISEKAVIPLFENIHRWKLIPKSTVGYSKAEVTRGGVDTHDLSSKTMESKKVPGLYFIGEVVDVTGWLGGYNFQWAWSSGWAAGQVV